MSCIDDYDRDKRRRQEGASPPQCSRFGRADRVQQSINMIPRLHARLGISAEVLIRPT
jgi:antitoxin component HigA of HigAB toxin-antitoxin module